MQCCRDAAARVARTIDNERRSIAPIALLECTQDSMGEYPRGQGTSTSPHSRGYFEIRGLGVYGFGRVPTTESSLKILTFARPRYEVVRLLVPHSPQATAIFFSRLFTWWYSSSPYDSPCPIGHLAGVNHAHHTTLYTREPTEQLLYSGLSLQKEQKARTSGAQQGRASLPNSSEPV
ncbi:hypothetical protein J6590_030226 [Homalodisca vitripennis]|nr:hypothetical protein J6590_030226 [Homalodisca vitripennis]